MISRRFLSLALTGITLSTLAFPGFCQNQNIERLPTLNVLCVAEQSTGFDWRGNKWSKSNFIANRKYIITKIPREKYGSMNLKIQNQIIFCEEPKVLDVTKAGESFSGWVSACYQVKPMGEESHAALDANQCDEWWDKGRLKKISCQKHNPQLYFHPDGSYIRYPWHSDIEKISDAKDSLALEVGSCSRIN